MLEYFLVRHLARRNALIVEAKGKDSGGIKVLTYVVWFLCEFIGAVIGASISPDGFAIYIFALGGAAVGALIINTIAHGITPGTLPAGDSATASSGPVNEDLPEEVS